MKARRSTIQKHDFEAWPPNEICLREVFGRRDPAAPARRPPGKVGIARLRRLQLGGVKVLKLMKGAPGKRGIPGPPGPAGPPGITGHEGPKGTAGSTGRKGRRGLTGSKGAAGVVGPAGRVTNLRGIAKQVEYI